VEVAVLTVVRTGEVVFSTVPVTALGAVSTAVVAWFTAVCTVDVGSAAAAAAGRSASMQMRAETVFAIAFRLPRNGDANG
jgi:hypothetical protein